MASTDLATRTSARETAMESARRMLEWPVARRVAFILGLALPVQGLVFLFHLLTIRGLDSKINSWLLTSTFAVWMVVTFVMYAIARRARDRGTGGEWTVYMLICGYGTMITVNIQIHGMLFSPLIVWLPMVLVLMFSVFGARTGIVTTLAIPVGLVGIVLAKAVGITTTAPVFVTGNIDDYVEVELYVAYVVIVLAITAFAGGLTLLSASDRERQRKSLEAANLELVQRSAELERGNELLRRYMPAEVAQKILSGDLSQVDEPRRTSLTSFRSDLVGFTSLAEQLDPEQLTRLLNEYLSEMATIADRHGGTIDKFVGDAVAVFFGAPTSRTNVDNARRAVSMAVDMRARLVEMSMQWLSSGIPRQIHARMGIHTGMAYVGNFGAANRMDYSAVGVQVALASKLEEHCVPGCIWVSQSTWSLIQNDFEFEHRGSLDIGPNEGTVIIYEVDPKGASRDLETLPAFTPRS